MKHRVRRRTQTVEAREAVEVPDDGHDAMRAKLGDILDAPREAVEANFGMEQARGA